MKKIIYIFIILILVLGTFKFTESNLFYIKNINIDGNYSLIEDDIVKKLYDLEGVSIFNVNISKLKNSISSDVRVDDIKVSRIFPNTLNIHIEQRVPKAIIYKNGQYLYLDGNLNIFTYYNEIKDKNIPLISIDDRENANEEFILLLEEVYNSKFYELISEIYYNNQYILTLLDGTNIYISKDIKTKKLDLAYKVYLEEIKNRQLDYIDLRFRDIVVK